MNVFLLFAIGLAAWVVGGLLLGLLIGAIARLRDRRRPRAELSDAVVAERFAALVEQLRVQS